MAHFPIGLESTMPKTGFFSIKNKLVACLWPCLVCTALQAAAAGSAPALLPNGVVRWTCNAFYLPARNIWQRTVDVEFDKGGVHAVRIDGVEVYAFNIQGTTLLTSLDAERIQVDTDAQTWASDLRGLASSQGRCER